MSTISISDLSPTHSESSLAFLSEEKEGLIESAVARAIDARKIIGGSSLLRPRIFGIYLSPARLRQ